MKKTVRILSLLMIAAMLCVMLASCAGKPNEDPKKAEEALDDAGYIVKAEEIDEDHAIQEAECLLVGMKFGDWDLELEDLFTMDEEESEELYGDIEGETLTVDLVIAVYFENEDDAEAWYDDDGIEYIEQTVESFESILEALEEEVEAYDITVEFEPGEITLDGCMVYIGTSGALKDAA